MWEQVYDPFGNSVLSTIAAAIPVVLRYVFFHSIALACLVGILVMLQAYVFPGMIVR